MNKQGTQYSSKSVETIDNSNGISTEAQNDLHDVLSRYVVQDINSLLEKTTTATIASLNVIKNSVETSQFTLNAVYDMTDENKKHLRNTLNIVKKLETQINDIINPNVDQILSDLTKAREEFTSTSQNIEEKLANSQNSIEGYYQNYSNELIQKSDELKKHISDSSNSIVSQNNEIINSTCKSINDELDSYNTEFKSRLSKIEDQLSTSMSKVDAEINNQISIINNLATIQSERIDKTITDVKNEMITAFNERIEQYNQKNQKLNTALLSLCATNLLGLIILIIHLFV